MIQHSSFKPGCGKLALKKEQLSNVTSAGIIFKEKEDPSYFRATVMALGDPKVLPTGVSERMYVKVGDKVLVNRRNGYHEIGDIVITEYDNILGVFDETE